MAGNIWEWTADWYDGNYYESSPERNPQGPLKGTARVLRGGAFSYHKASVRCVNRNLYYPSYQRDFLGFRMMAPQLLNR